MTRQGQAGEHYDPHVFAADEKGSMDWTGVFVDCLTCPFPRANAIHVTNEQLVAALPPTPKGAREIEDRMLGESA